MCHIIVQIRRVFALPFYLLSCLSVHGRTVVDLTARPVVAFLLDLSDTLPSPISPPSPLHHPTLILPHYNRHKICRLLFVETIGRVLSFMGDNNDNNKTETLDLDATVFLSRMIMNPIDQSI